MGASSRPSRLVSPASAASTASVSLATPVPPSRRYRWVTVGSRPLLTPMTRSSTFSSHPESGNTSGSPIQTLRKSSPVATAWSVFRKSPAGWYQRPSVEATAIGRSETTMAIRATPDRTCGMPKSEPITSRSNARTPIPTATASASAAGMANRAGPAPASRSERARRTVAPQDAKARTHAAIAQARRQLRPATSPYIAATTSPHPKAPTSTGPSDPVMTCAADGSAEPPCHRPVSDAKSPRCTAATSHGSTTGTAPSRPNRVELSTRPTLPRTPIAPGAIARRTMVQARMVAPSGLTDPTTAKINALPAR